MKKNNIFNLSFVVLLLSLISFSACQTNKEFGENYDIKFPAPTITSIQAKTAEVASEFKVTGTGLDEILNVVVSGKTCKIISKTATEIKVQLPRVFAASKVTVTNKYDQIAMSEDLVAPVYPNIAVDEFPAEIEATRSFSIKGTNVDLITEVTVDGKKIAVDGAGADMGSLMVSVADIQLTVGSEVIVSCKSKFTANLSGGTSGAIPVVAPKEFFIPAAPIVLWDFEDGVNPYQATVASAKIGINKSTGIPHGRGDKYLSIRYDAVPGAWDELGKMTYSKPIDLAAFHDPYLSFMINTEEVKGYFQVEVTQGGVKSGAHFTAGLTGNDGDGYTFRATGSKWQYISVPFSKMTWENWGGGLLKFKKDGTISEIVLTMKQGNGAPGAFALNLDQVQITDGPSMPAVIVQDFEDGVTHWADNSEGTALVGMNLAAVPYGHGDKFLTVSKANAASWSWLGAVEYNNSIDLAAFPNAYINIMVNTGTKVGFIQIETFQEGTKWGAGVNAENTFSTNGKWQMISLRIADIAWGNWGGTGTKLNPKKAVDYIKLGITTGNNANVDFETSVDFVSISNYPMW